MKEQFYVGYIHKRTETGTFRAALLTIAKI